MTLGCIPCQYDLCRSCPGGAIQGFPVEYSERKSTLRPRHARSYAAGRVVVSDDVASSLTVPVTHKDFLELAAPEKELWLRAMREEVDNLLGTNTLEPSSLKEAKSIPDSTIMGSRWVFALKADGRLKARVVSKGFNALCLRCLLSHCE